MIFVPHNNTKQGKYIQVWLQNSFIVKYLVDVCTYPHVHISQMHFSLCFLSEVFEDDLIAKSSFTVDALDVEVDVTLVFMVENKLVFSPSEKSRTFKCKY